MSEEARKRCETLTEPNAYFFRISQDGHRKLLDGIMTKGKIIIPRLGSSFFAGTSASGGSWHVGYLGFVSHARHRNPVSADS